LELLGPLNEPVATQDGQFEVHRPAELTLNDQEQRVLQAIGRNPTTLDEVIASSEMAASQVLATISILEVRRLVRRLEGSRIVRV